MKNLKTFEFFDVSQSSHRDRWGDLINNVNEIADEFGEEVEDELNCGAMGCAFELKSGRVLKLTMDKEEAHAAYRSKRRTPRKHIIGYYDIRRIDTDFNEGKLWGIIMDLVYTLNKIEQDTYRTNREKFFDEGISDEDLRKSIDAQLKNPGTWVVNAGLGVNSWRKEVKSFWNKLLPQRQEILRDIDKSGIFSLEAHSKNVGFDKYGTFKIFDIWMSDIGNPEKKFKFNKDIKLRRLSR